MSAYAVPDADKQNRSEEHWWVWGCLGTETANWEGVAQYPLNQGEV